MLAQWKTVTSCTRPAGALPKRRGRLNPSLPTPRLNTGGKSNEAQIFLIPVLPNTATPKLKEDQVPTPYYKSRMQDYE
jgi:hypothetical protein